MNEKGKRSLAYGSAALLAGGLVYGGFVYSPPADLWTILSSVDTQLRLAYVIPPRDKEGNLFSEREKMLDYVGVLLEQAEEIRPGFAPVAEYRGFLLSLRGDYMGAAAVYRAARDMEDCSRELHDSLVFNEVRMLRKAGSPAQALDTLEVHRGQLQGKYVAQADLDRARLMADLGRPDAAADLARSVGANGAEDPVAAVRAGQILEDLGRVEAADAAYVAAATGSPVANYYRSRLKVGRGDVDSALELLELAALADASTVRRLVQRDQQAWEAVAGTARFRKLASPPEEAAQPGR